MPSLLGDSVFSMILAAILPVVALGALFWAFRLTRQNNHLITAMDNMSQGLCMFDGSAKLVVANKRYREIYRLPPERTQPGCSLRELLAVRRDTGTFDGDPDKYVTNTLAEISAGKPFNKVIELKTGMVVALATRPMRGGGWVVTHDDITEQRAKDAQHASLANQEERRVKIETAIRSFRERVEAVLGTV